MADWIEEDENGINLNGKRKWKEYLCQMKGKFKCYDCENDNKKFFRNYDNKCWTSRYCTIEFLAKKVERNDTNKGSVIKMKVMARAFNQTCNKCDNIIQIIPYEDELKRVAKKFCFQMAKDFRFVVGEKNLGNIKKSAIGGHHIKDLCESCAAGKCFFKDKN